MLAGTGEHVPPPFWLFTCHSQHAGATAARASSHSRRVSAAPLSRVPGAPQAALHGDGLSRQLGAEMPLAGPAGPPRPSQCGMSWGQACADQIRARELVRGMNALEGQYVGNPAPGIYCGATGISPSAPLRPGDASPLLIHLQRHPAFSATSFQEGCYQMKLSLSSDFVLLFGEPDL